MRCGNRVAALLLPLIFTLTSCAADTVCAGIPPRAIQSASPALESEPLPACDITVPDRLSAPNPAPADEPTDEPSRESSHDPRKIVPLSPDEYTTYGMMEHFDSEAERLRKMLPEDVARRVDEKLKEIYREIEEENSFVDDDGNLHCGSIVGPLMSIARAEAYERALEEPDQAESVDESG